MNLRIIRKNQASDPVKGLPPKILFESPIAAQRPCRQRGSYDLKNLSENFHQHRSFR